VRCEVGVATIVSQEIKEARASITHQGVGGSLGVGVDDLRAHVPVSHAVGPGRTD